ncbi:hypothetical protein FAZ69_32365 [Trinickia terrae]|uniref:Uncharacterized protein n=1 Tax=Trinickia terrae TaxID=2571161 RepID=A0A4U1HDN6_9BURK|nr:hypothetical protein [Trinickia terrae]TKC77973.1 hypothetical protein FAZ69_32365 [Trinickia terrae]
MSLELSNNNVFSNFSTDPNTYLNALNQGNGSSQTSPQSMIQELIQDLSQLLKQQENGGQGGNGGNGGSGGEGGTPSGAMPTTTGATPGAPGTSPSTGGLPTPTGGSLPTMGGTPGGAGQMTAQNASGVLAAYMGSSNTGTLDPNAMYKLAENADGNTPQTVQQAAKFMLANPDTYQKIETHDVGGTDGISGAGNFQWAAQGGLGAAGNVPSGGSGATPAPMGMTPRIGTTIPTGTTPGMTGTTPGMTGTTPGMTGTTPSTTSSLPTPKGTGDLVNDGKSLQMGDEGQALSNFNQQDPASFQAFQNALSHGDGNSACHILANAVSSGKISQSTGAALGAQVQQTANAHGGGKINGDASNALSSALGGNNVLTPGKTRGAIAFENLFGINTSSVLGVSTQ